MTNERPKPRCGAPHGHRVRCTIDIDAPADDVFDLWTRLEALPGVLRGVRRVKRVSAWRSLWDVEIAGRQFVWEAEVTDFLPAKRIAWESRAGTRHAGAISFESLPGERTRLDVEIVCEPRGLMERLGARLDVVARQVDRDLAAFRRYAEGAPHREGATH